MNYCQHEVVGFAEAICTWDDDLTGEVCLANNILVEQWARRDDLGDNTMDCKRPPASHPTLYRPL